ncbi:hypothetical protein [Nocardia altamirensis]|nr:hypothetical protein [Nocardia altamirensis]
MVPAGKLMSTLAAITEELVTDSHLALIDAALTLDRAMDGTRPTAAA